MPSIKCLFYHLPDFLIEQKMTRIPMVWMSSQLWKRRYSWIFGYAREKIITMRETLFFFVLNWLLFTQIYSKGMGVFSILFTWFIYVFFCSLWFIDICCFSGLAKFGYSLCSYLVKFFFSFNILLIKKNYIYAP